MISITCSNCKRVLTIDEAFAGGVCRCQHCGTIQTVPSPKPTVVRAAAPTVVQTVGAAAPSRTTTRLEELAEAVASSGLARKGLGSQPPVQVALEEPPAERRLWAMPIMLIGGGVLLLLAVILAIVLWPHRPAVPGAPEGSFEGPSFCGVPLKADSAIFLLDRGNSVGDMFDRLKATCYKTIEQLGPDRKFQIILWDEAPGGTQTVEYPRDAMQNATSAQIENLRRDFQDITASGSTSVSGPLKEAIARKPQVIVIATGKWEMDEADVEALRSAAASGIRIIAVQIGSAAPGPELQQAAKSTGGEFRAVSGQELLEFSR